MKRLIVIVVFLLIGFSVFNNETKKMNDVQESLAKKIIRLHIRANSDSDEDQALKLLVRDEVCDYLSKMLKESQSIEETREIISENMSIVKEIALDTVKAAGYDYDVNIYFENTYFPLKTYGDLTFPPGVYEAFCIDIGGGEGHNWWCVMYPPLCFVESTYAVVPDESKKMLRQILDDAEYNAVTLRDCDSSQIEFRFKIVEILESL